MSDKFILDASGQPLRCDDLPTWALWMEHGGDRIVAQDEIGNTRISTVFLGLDHSFGHGPLVLWETMIFGGPHDGYQERYSTRGEAEQGHQVALDLVRQVPA